MPKQPVYEVEIRPSGRGGYEIADLGAPSGMGFGNYASPEDAYTTACFNYEPNRIKKYEFPVAAKTMLKLRQVKKGGA